MNRFVSILALGTTLMASSAAFAGEPTGRYQGAVGSVPDGVEQVYFDHSSNGRGGVTASVAANIPAASNSDHVFALLQPHGRAYMVTAFSIPTTSDNDVRLADLFK